MFQFWLGNNLKFAHKIVIDKQTHGTQGRSERDPIRRKTFNMTIVKFHSNLGSIIHEQNIRTMRSNDIHDQMAYILGLVQRSQLVKATL